MPSVNHGRPEIDRPPLTVTLRSMPRSLFFISIMAIAAAIQGRADDLRVVLNGAKQQQARLNCVVFTPGKTVGFSALYSHGFFNRFVPEDAHRFMHGLAAQGFQPKCIAFTPDGGWSMLHQFNSFMNLGIPDPAHQAMMKIIETGPELK